MPPAPKKCYCRFNTDTFLYTCLREKGHDGVHRDESAVEGDIEWLEEQGWYDQCGDSPEKSRTCPNCLRAILAKPDAPCPCIEERSEYGSAQ